MPKVKIFTFLLITALVLGVSVSNARVTRGILGSQAPEFNLNSWVDENGDEIPPIKLSNLKGKVVVAEFWQSWCPGLDFLSLSFVFDLAMVQIIPSLQPML